MKIQSPTLPFGLEALEPHISRKALENHLNNHHRRYVDRTNELISGTPMQDMTLEEVIQRTTRRKTTSELFNNAAQAFNHTFFWRSLRPNGGGRPKGAIARQIDSDFRGYDDFVAKFHKAAKSLFASGWVWLVVDRNKIKIATTKDANTPGVRGLKPILALNLWEHAYYMDYGARRDAYVEAFLNSLVNWDFANENLARAGLTHMNDRTVERQPVQATNSAAAAE
jgi:Fe-Mn family superoxide dismutase